MPISQILLAGGDNGPRVSWSNIYYSNVNEGQQNTVYLDFRNWNNSTVYWWLVDADNNQIAGNQLSSANTGIFSPGSGDYTNYESFNFTFAADSTADGSLTYYIRIENSNGELLMPRQGPFTVNDTSQQPAADFTIEWWQKVDNGGGSSPRPWAVGSYPEQQLAISYEGRSSDFFWINNSYINATSQDHRGQGWRHIAYVRNSGVVRGYINGTQYTPNINNSQLITGTNIPLYVGTGETGGAGNFNGYITNLHIMKGVAKYNGNFTPPTMPLQLATGSVFLLPALNQNSKFYNIAETAIATETGSVTWSSDTPFTTTEGPYTQFTNLSGQSGGGVYVISFTGANYNADLLNVKSGWTVTNGVISGTVIGNAVENSPGMIDIPIDFNAAGQSTWTFTQPAPGGSLYFNGSSYLNYGASVNWAMDA
jgi:hypothetical protein